MEALSSSTGFQNTIFEDDSQGYFVYYVRTFSARLSLLVTNQFTTEITENIKKQEIK